MSPPPPLLLSLADAEATARLGRELAPLLRPGDTLLLQGPIGTGKTHLARALIQERQRAAGRIVEDVPSPSFTLVQTYDADDGEIWHADLFRLGSAAEADELGLTDAFEDAICLIEWPERLGSATPRDALRLCLAYAGDAREVTILADGLRWAPIIAHLRGAFAADSPPASRS